MLLRRKTKATMAATALPELAEEVAKAMARVKRAEAKLETARKAHTELTELYSRRAAERMEF